MTTTFPRVIRPQPVDSWTLNTLREGKAFRDAHPSTTPEDIANDAALDEWLAAVEALAAAAGTYTEAPVADAEPARRSGTPSGASRYGSDRNAASEKQVAFIASLAARLGVEPEQPRDKSHASLIIDRLKKAIAAAPASTPTARPTRPATENQANYLADLVATRDHAAAGIEVPEDLTAVTFDQASALIDSLRSLPRTRQARLAHGIREGRYAYQATEEHVEFYRVTRTGRIHVVAGPQEWPYNGKLNEGLEWIKANQREAAALFGRLIGTCGRCGLPLTDDNSRAVGLGPICQGKEW